MEPDLIIRRSIISALKKAGGEYLLFLNNDTEIVNEDCLEELLGYCMREDVGAVGARLYYEDGSIQHAGVIVGLGGVAGHAFTDFPHESPGYFGRIVMAQDYSAATATHDDDEKTYMRKSADSIRSGQLHLTMWISA